MSQQRLTAASEKTPQRSERRAAGPAAARSFPGGLHPILQLQRTIGNRAVGRLLQAKLAVSHPGAPYAREADGVAEQVTSLPAPASMATTQRQRIPEEEKDTQPLQTHPLAASMPPLAQRQARPEAAQKAAPLVQKKSLAARITPGVQRQMMTDEEQKAAPPGQRQSTLHRAAGAERGDAGAAREPQLGHSSGTGSPLPTSVRSSMEPRFGTDFSSVRVHTGSDPTHLHRALRAQAFTVGQDSAPVHSESAVNFRSVQLLAYELTHVVQQSGRSPRVPQAAAVHSHPGVAVATPSVDRANGVNAGLIQRQPKSDGPTFRDLPIFLGKLELDVGKNLQDYGHHLYQAAMLHPDEPDVLQNELTRYALSLNVLKTSYRFAGFKQSTADKLALGTGILFKSLTFVREGEFIFDFQVDIGRGVKFETNLELGVNPKDVTEVRKAGVNFGLVGRF